MTKLLGLDLSTVWLGWACTYHPFGARPTAIGQVKLSGKTWQERLDDLGMQLPPIIRHTDPELAAIEWPILATWKNDLDESRSNPGSLIKQGIFVGAAMMVLHRHEVECRHFPNPTKVKEALTSNPRATKEDMKIAAKIVAGSKVSEHAADALGVAYALGGMLNEETWASDD